MDTQTYPTLQIESSYSKLHDFKIWFHIPRDWYSDSIQLLASSQHNLYDIYLLLCVRY